MLDAVILRGWAGAGLLGCCRDLRWSQSTQVQHDKWGESVWKDSYTPATLMTTAPCYCTQPGRALFMTAEKLFDFPESNKLFHAKSKLMPNTAFV